MNDFDLEQDLIFNAIPIQNIVNDTEPVILTILEADAVHVCYGTETRTLCLSENAEGLLDDTLEPNTQVRIESFLCDSEVEAHLLLLLATSLAGIKSLLDYKSGTKNEL